MCAGSSLACHVHAKLLSHRRIYSSAAPPLHLAIALPTTAQPATYHATAHQAAATTHPRQPPSASSCAPALPPAPQLLTMPTLGKLLAIMAVALPIITAAGFVYSKMTGEGLKESSFKVRWGCAWCERREGRLGGCWP